MTDKIQISVDIPRDHEGMLGRECLECKRYFKIKPGTGLPTSYCHCPYCEYEGDSNTFWTEAQIKYAESVAIKKAFNQFVKPSLDKLTDSFKDLERSSRNSFIKFKVTVTGGDFKFPTKYYREKELETKVICDNCGLEFSIYGVFSRCPDCKELNAFLIFDKSLEITQKQLFIFSNPEIPEEVRQQSFSFILTSCISTFDGLGKELRQRNPGIYPKEPKNLFQNISLLDEKLNKYLSQNHSDFGLITKLFQVRHIYEHNMGVIDKDFINKLPEFRNKQGQKYNLTQNELELFIIKMKELGDLIKDHLKKNST
jgi:hypothetical protein